VIRVLVNMWLCLSTIFLVTLFLLVILASFVVVVFFCYVSLKYKHCFLTKSEILCDMHNWILNTFDLI
jgi:hypothetical protein